MSGHNMRETMLLSKKKNWKVNVDGITKQLIGLHALQPPTPPPETPARMKAVLKDLSRSQSASHFFFFPWLKAEESRGRTVIEFYTFPFVFRLSSGVIGSDVCFTLPQF
jgi:hypothetical protein